MKAADMTGEARDYMVAPGMCFKIIHEEDTLTYPGPNRFFMDLYNPQKKDPQMKKHSSLSCIRARSPFT